MIGTATIKLVGNLGKTTEIEPRKYDKIAVMAPVRLGDAIHDLEVQHSLLLRRDSMLILINGVEADALEDLDTIVKENDEVVLIPMFHGGSSV